MSAAPPLGSIEDAIAELSWVATEARALERDAPGRDAAASVVSGWEARRREHDRRRARLLARLEAGDR